jgi:succinate dehydrogenase / fumarate reductase cytochrome b subunit
VILALIWGYLHHFCAGIRFLLLDVHVGVTKPASAKSAVRAGGQPAAHPDLRLKLFGLF